MKVLIINGPNLNFLGIREPEIYGRQTYADLLAYINDYCAGQDIEAQFFQSNHEGAIIDAIQDAYGKMDGMIINPGAYSHTSIAILDALKAVGLPTVEVHLSDIAGREPFRRHSYISQACLSTISGLHFKGYVEALRLLQDTVNK
ncbi:MAG: type II 3-dehydroquinate dehydratase [Clostridia bacterium]|nr:type II 3-dehydroquinate dehydratase [Clostridia bacterium]